MEALTPGTLALIGAVCGGAFAIVNGALRLVERLLPQRRNNSAAPKTVTLDRPCFSEGDRAGLVEMRRALERCFKIAEQQTEILRNMERAGALFAESFKNHIRDFRCMAEAVDTIEDNVGKDQRS